MTKAVLVMDMPECCADCQLADEDIDELYCTPADDYYDGVNRTKDRASFCPLRELPEKKETLTTIECHSNGRWTEGMKAGWNACLDRILGEPPEKGVASKRGNPAG